MEYLRSHPYLFANIPCLVIFLSAIRFVLRREDRKWVIISGLSCIPCAIISTTHQMDYWRPVRLGGLLPGIEDMIFCFLSGGLTWLAATLGSRGRIVISSRTGPALLRYSAIGVSYGIAFDLFFPSMVSSMDATVTLTTIAAAGLVSFRRNLLPLAIAGLVFFTPLYLLIAKIQFRIWPEYILYWIPESPWSSTVAGLPLGEIAWATSFAAFWPLFMGFVWDAELGSSPRTSGRAAL